MVKNYAVIDIGTLKVKCLVAQLLASGELKEVYFSNTLTCFGVGLDENQGLVQEKYLERTIDELKRCQRLLQGYQVAGGRVVSTHALRRAKNREEIVQRIYQETGWRVENLSQNQEAELFFRGVINGLEKNQDYAVVDVGGGSVQILVGNHQELKKIHLLQTGAQYLHDNFTRQPHVEDSLTSEADLEKMRRYILKQLLPLKGIGDLPLVYGSSNVIDLMKAIHLPLEENPGSATHPYRTYAKHLREFIRQVLPLSYKQREEKFPFQYGYMWGIDKAFLNVVTMSEVFPSSYIIPSNANLARGLICEMISDNCA